MDELNGPTSPLTHEPNTDLKVYSCGYSQKIGLELDQKDKEFLARNLAHCVPSLFDIHVKVTPHARS